jgi:hypothetical protein
MRENKRIVLAELQRAFDKKYAASDILDGKLQNTLNFTSIIVSIVSAIEASSFVNKVGNIFWFVLGIVIILYILVVWLVLVRGLNPTSYDQPISNNWDELEERYFLASEEDNLDLVISQHLCSIECAGKENIRKAQIICWSSALMILIVILLFIAIPLGLLFR